MKNKEYIEKHRKVLEPLNYILSQMAVLSILESMGEEIGGEFSERVNKFIDKEREIMLNSEVEQNDN